MKVWLLQLGEIGQELRPSGGESTHCHPVASQRGDKCPDLFLHPSPSCWCFLLTKPTRKPDGKRPSRCSRPLAVPAGRGVETGWRRLARRERPGQGSLHLCGNLRPASPAPPGEPSHPPGLCSDATAFMKLCTVLAAGMTWLLSVLSSHAVLPRYASEDTLLYATGLTTYWWLRRTAAAPLAQC